MPQEQARKLFFNNQKSIFMKNVYGVLLNGSHVDVSKTEKGAKNFATRNGYLTVTVRYNCGYIAREIAHKYNGKWKTIKPENSQIRYNTK